VARWKVECTVGEDLEIEADRYREGKEFIELVVVRKPGTAGEKEEVVLAVRKDAVRAVRKLPKP
jgi:hypothetical protein